MPLLQITEPEATLIQHPAQPSGCVVGIDLGTTYSLVANVQNGKTEVLLDDQGNALLPSVVHYEANGQIQVGEEAKHLQSKDPKNTFVSIKRLMGRGFIDATKNFPERASGTIPYDLIEDSGLIRLKTVAGVKTPVEISAEILRTLKNRAETRLQEPLLGAVITVPAYFDDAQRQATKDAAQLAGINVLRLINEPTAAAIAYGLDHQSTGIFAIYDLGGGTFDCSILKLTQGVFEVLATAGDVSLGGDDFDMALADWILQESDISELTPEDYRYLLSEVRILKELLSSEQRGYLHLRLSSERVIQQDIDHELFARLTMNLVERTFYAVQRALQDAKIGVKDIDGVVLVGGATRMPHLRRAVKDFFQKEPLINLDPERVVAMGAALQANLLAGNQQQMDDILLLDVIPLSLGLETMGGVVEPIIQRNTAIPCVYAQEFTTFQNGQTAMSFHVVQGEREFVAECRSLAHFELRGIPPLPAGIARIRVTFSVDADGLLTVTAQELSTRTTTHMAIKPSYGLTEAEILHMLQNSVTFKHADDTAKASLEVKLDAERLLKYVEHALLADEQLLSKDEYSNIQSAMHKLRASLVQEDIPQIKDMSRELDHATADFATRRMEKSMRTALTGRPIQELI